MSTFFPLPSTYLVAQLDVQATLSVLNDPIADAEGADIQPARCIVYLHTIHQLPFPDNATFKYGACLVGRGLRSEVPEKCITSDMCTPIFPNTFHPSGAREPIHPEQPFPLEDCYHWNGIDMQVDLRILNDGQRFNKSERMSLPPRQHFRMEDLLSADIYKSFDAIKARDAPPSRILDETQEQRSSLVATESRPVGGEPPVDFPPRCATPSHELETSPPHKGNEVDYASDRGSTTASSRSSCYSVDGCSDRAGASLEALNSMDIFGLNWDERDELIPIVRVSPDIASCAELDAEDLDPSTFVKQYNELVRIVKESKARARTHSTSSDPKTNVFNPPNIAHYLFAESNEPEGTCDVESDLQNRDGPFWAEVLKLLNTLLCLR